MFPQRNLVIIPTRRAEENLPGQLVANWFGYPDNPLTVFCECAWDSRDTSTCKPQFSTRASLCADFSTSSTAILTATERCSNSLLQAFDLPNLSPRSFFFPRASERRVLPMVGVCKTSSHLHIFSSSHLLIFASSHLHICSSSHLHICSSSHLLHICSSSHLLLLTSSHLLILTSSHLRIFSSSHLLIFTPSHLHICSSSHLLMLTSSHLHILTSSHLLIFTSAHLHILTSSHLHIFSSCPLALSFFSISLLKAGGRGSANETARNATFSHEMMFDHQKLK